ncbi:hypothetical protein H072_11292 [Dactylellina haptotyla CBS 200.50]|uniref:Carboxymuconolactone decarboxylase-like domain-containing protein n=1 Tax=Dactylellina haptotyla (strain CBS 200.50) TaxID=1284197 RepID=S8B8J3_DACHA|nr:hypothetical protein H072_11292 [Dactylellina haptotyla CBS 200.50]
MASVPAAKDEVECPPDRTTEEALALFRDIEESFPKSLGEDKWYLIILATLTYGPNPSHIADLYKYLISLPQYSTPASRQALIKRIREGLLKLVSIIGVCKPLLAIWAIGEIEQEEDKDFSCSREGWQADEKNLERGKEWLGKIYRHNMKGNDDKFVAHKDFGWISYNITYGLYLSDHSILDPIETEIIVLGGILIQNLPTVSNFHLRGARRLGISMEDVEAMQVCSEKIAKFCRLRMDKLPRVADIEHEVPWENDMKA